MSELKKLVNKRAAIKRKVTTIQNALVNIDELQIIQIETYQKSLTEHLSKVKECDDSIGDIYLASCEKEDNLSGFEPWVFS